MAQNVTIANATYSSVPAIEVPKQGGGTAAFFDVSDTTATASDVAQGKYFFSSLGIYTEGTAVPGGGSAITVVDTPDAAGGTVRTITAVDLSTDTIDAAHLVDSFTAHDHLGNPVTGSLSIVTYYTGSSAPASSLGQDGDIYLQE